MSMPEVACAMIASDTLDNTDYDDDGDVDDDDPDQYGDRDGSDHQYDDGDGGDIDADDSDDDSTASVRRKASLKWSSLGPTGRSSRTRAP